MELRQLEHFLGVAEHLNFTRAARELHLVQSALSTSIRTLEHELGVRLFERSTRRVYLTAEGAALVPAARRVLHAAKSARDEVDAVRGLVRGRLALGTIQTLTWVDLPALLSSFHRAHAGVEITLQEAPVDRLVAELRAGELDLAFIARDASPLPDDVTVLARHEEELVLVTAPEHRLARAGSAGRADLADEGFIDFQAGTGLQTVVERLCARSGLVRQLACRVTQLDLLLQLVAGGLGVAIVPAPVALRSGLPAVSLDLTQPFRSVALVARGSGPGNPAAQALLPLLLRAAREGQPATEPADRERH